MERDNGIAIVVRVTPLRGVDGKVVLEEGSARRLAAGISLGVLVVSTTGMCGGQSTSSPSTTCGPGTVLVSGQCLVAEASGSGHSDSGQGDASDTASEVSAMGDDSPTPLSGDGPSVMSPDATDSTAPADGSASVDATTPSEAALATDAALDSGDAQSTPDPCRVTNVNCDATCGKMVLSPSCANATCGPTVRASLSDPPFIFDQHPQSIRTPDAPGIDPNCTAQCPSWGFVYGLGFQIPQVTSPNDTFYRVVVRVGPPWQLGSFAQPYCPRVSANVHDGCIDLVGGGQSIFVMTKDPNAPARNISLDYGPSAKGCP